MKCSGCGQEFKDIGELKRHKPNCANEPGPEVKPCVIPLALLPDEIKYYAPGHTVGLRVTGRLVATGIEIQEVSLIR